MSNVPAQITDYDTGLEQFGIEDAVIPRISIDHKQQEWKDSLTNEQFPFIKTIILGLQKQRVLFHHVVDDGDMPMCKSANFGTGFPNLDEDVKKDKRFPWDKSGFAPNDYKPDKDGLVRLPCEGCQLKEWGSHPDGKKPYCAEQFTLPILYDPRDDGDWVPAIVTFQKTSLKPLKAYLSSFARSRNAAFQAITEMSLTPEKRGNNEYAVPKFKRIGDTDEENWREYSANFRAMRDFLVADPGSRDEDGPGIEAPSDNTAKPPADKEAEEKEEAANAPVDAEIVEDPPAEPTASADDDDDLPF
jgi:hypothetical protein